MADKQHLVQILLTLVSNAIKYTQNGSISIVVSYEPNMESIPEEYKGMQPVT